VATITLFFLCIFFNETLKDIHLKDLEIIFLMALISGVFGHTLYNWALRYIHASIASLYLLIEPLSSALMAYLIPWINQTPSIYTILGGCFILSGIYLSVRMDEV
jgi:drug/metabolite transporter (DMT)-like permease